MKMGQGLDLDVKWQHLDTRREGWDLTMSAEVRVMVIIAHGDIEVGFPVVTTCSHIPCPLGTMTLGSRSLIDFTILCECRSLRKEMPVLISETLGMGLEMC